MINFKKELRVKNIVNNNGKAVPNQFEIKDMLHSTFYYISYDTIIMVIEKGKISVDKKYWNYSRTTLKYMNLFLEDFNFMELARMTAKQKEEYFTKYNYFENLN